MDGMILECLQYQALEEEDIHHLQLEFCSRIGVAKTIVW